MKAHLLLFIILCGFHTASIAQLSGLGLEKSDTILLEDPNIFSDKKMNF